MKHALQLDVEKHNAHAASTQVSRLQPAHDGIESGILFLSDSVQVIQANLHCRMVAELQSLLSMVNSADRSHLPCRYFVVLRHAMQAWAAHMCRQYSKKQQQQQLLAVRSVWLNHEAWQAWKHGFLPLARHKRCAAARAGAHWRRSALRACLLGWIEVGISCARCAGMCWSDHQLQPAADFPMVCEGVGKVVKQRCLQYARLDWGLLHPACLFQVVLWVLPSFVVPCCAVPCCATQHQSYT